MATVDDAKQRCPNVASVMVSLFADRRKPVLPAGRADEMVELLATLMVWPDLFEAYCAALEAARANQGLNLDLLRRPVPDIPWDEIVEKGFESLTHDQIADVMISPETLLALRDYIDEPGTNRGPWFHRLVDKIVREQESEPLSEEDLHRIERVSKKLELSEAFKKPQDIDTSADQSKSVIPQTKKDSRKRMAGWGLAILGMAACLLIGIFLGTRGRGDFEFSRIAGNAEYAVRGPKLSDVTISTGPFKGYLTAVAILPGQPDRPVVFPLYPSAHVPVVPGKPATLPVPRDAQSAVAFVVIVTPTPAGETLARDLDLGEKRFGSHQTNELEQHIVRVLRESNYEKVAVTTISVQAKKE